jgi:hypothetical protein
MTSDATSALVRATHQRKRTLQDTLVICGLMLSGGPLCRS